MKISWRITGVILSLLIIILVGSLVTSTAKAQEPRLITVLGDAEIRVVPDEVVISMAVETNSAQLATAKKTNDQRVRKIIALAEKFQIEAKHIQTSQISIEPRYRNSYEKSEFIGYFVRKNIVVQLKELSKFEDFLSNVLEEGVNYMQGIQFRSSALEENQRQVQALAVKAAKEKATRLAGELGQQIGEPQLIQEEGSYHSPLGVERNLTKQAQSYAMADTGESAFAPGEIIIRSAVVVSFRLK